MRKKTSKYSSRILLSLVILLFIIIALLIRKSQQAVLNTHSFSPVQLTAQEEDLLVTNDKFLQEKIKQSGPAAVLTKLDEVTARKNIFCHDKAHVLGRLTYEVFGSESFKLCSSECHSGCYHGATEAYFRDKGTANLEQNLSLICQNESNRFFSHQCLHGVGHGLMAWTDYELYDALDACEKLPNDNQKHSCATGVFMENIVGGLSETRNTGHITKYLSSDPQYPCDSIPQKYKSDCYFLQTSRMMQLFQSDFHKIATECMKVPEKYRSSCFQSIGRDINGSSNHDVTKSIANCQYAPFGDYRNDCLAGAVQDTFWTNKGEGEALTFCSLLKDEKELKRCYETIINRAKDILDKEKYQEFCQKIPPDYRNLCLNSS